MLRLPIGYDIFGSLIEQKFDFIDKTLFVKDVFDDDSQIILITRPRRFGKTLNLSMLHHFLVEDAYGLKTKGIFDKFKISQVDGGKYMEHQGKYPVMFVTLKDVRDDKFAHAYACLKNLISGVYREHQYLLESSALNAADKELFIEIIKGKAEQAKMEESFKTLSGYLFKYYGVKPWLLIDEYDTPLQAAYLHGYYTEMINVLRSLFGAALKTNPYLYKSVITGILRISKESIFSELNNLSVYSVLQNEYSQYFGFTEEEMDYILQKSSLEAKATEIRRWYNGYQFGKTIVYNPWSIVNCVKKEGELKPYWVNTSGNNLIKKLIINSNLEFKENIEQLIQNNSIKTPIDEYVTFGDLTDNESAIWSLLVAAGYLKVTASQMVNKKILCTLEIPNFEVNILYSDMIEQWLAGKQDLMWYSRFLEYLLNGEIEKFTAYLKEVMLQIVSVHDVAKEPEAFYHGLMLGFTASLNKDNYEIKSNKESGFGRYDIAIIPKDIAKKAIILELKSVKLKSKELKDLDEDALEQLLDKEAQNALAQIANLNYQSEIKARGLTNIVKIGIAFCGKELRTIGQICEV